ncbi:MurR/RpiR family transcriptional regulator [Mollicutes bacterium LVI A0039]|nr:MurR/RpiR family transcriptional regulator [Mollicutes bacterium LVI A0039]
MYIDIYENVKLSKDYNNLSQGQKDIHQYILSNLERMRDVTVEDIASKCFCSTTSVNRYCKKMGANGYSELKHALLEYGNYGASNRNSALNRHVLSKTEGLNLNDVTSIAQLLLEKKHVYIFGTGSSYMHAKYLQRLLIRCGINAIATNEVHYLRIIKDVELCVVISNTGETFSAVQVVNQMRDKCKVISLTRANSRVQANSDLSLFHNEEMIVDDSISNELNISLYLMIVSLVNTINEQLSTLD